MKTLAELKPSELRELADLQDRVLAIIEREPPVEVVQRLALRRHKPHWSQTPKGRAKLARAQRARWRKARK